MAFVLKDRVRETTDTNGTGAIRVTGAVGGYQRFNDVLSNGDTTLVCVKNDAGQWQTFLATWNSATQTLARTTAYEGSSGAGVNVNFSGEAQKVWINYPAQKYQNPHFQTLSIGTTYSVPSAPRKITVYEDQTLSGSGGQLFRIGGIARGTLSANLEGYFGYVLDEDRVAFSNTNLGMSVHYMGTTLRAGWSGGRTLHATQLYVGNPASPGTSAAGTAGPSAYHVSGASFAYSYTEAGGQIGAYRGNLFGRNDATRIRNGSGYFWNSTFGNETDVGVESGNEALWKGGIKVVQWSTDINRGIIQDYAYGINLQAGGTPPGWRIGFALGGFEGWWPFTSDSTVMKAIDANTGGGPSKAFAAGIDFRGITVGESSFAAPGYKVDGSGNLGALVASGVSLQTRSDITAKAAVVASVDVLEGGLFAGTITLTGSAPTGSGTTATFTVATCSIPYANSVSAAGTGYAVGDTITVSGGTYSQQATGTVTKVGSNGEVRGIKLTTPGSYSVLPSSPVSTTTSGAGSGFTFMPQVSILTVTVAGAGTNYSEFLPPTIASTGSLATYRPALFRVNMTATQGELLLNSGNRVVIPTSVTPASATATGTAGTIAWDADYIYVCTASNTWKRAAIATW